MAKARPKENMPVADQDEAPSTPTPHPDIAFDSGVRLRTFHDRHYSWRMVDREDAPPGAVITAANEEGKVSVREIVPWVDNFTLTEIPGSFVENQLWANTLCQVPWSQEAMDAHPGGPEGYEADRIQAALSLKPRISRKALIARLMREAGYERHCPLDAITFIECSEDPELEDYLNTAFEAKGRTVVPDAEAPVPAEEEEA